MKFYFNLHYKFVSGLFFACFLGSCSNSFDGKNGIKTVKFPGSDKICQTIEYKDGKKNGTLKEYFQNGSLRTVQHFKDDKNVDTALYYFANGQLAALQVHDDGEKWGCWKKYNESGGLYSDICFKNDVVDGEAKTYTYKSLRLLEHFNYINGIQQGKQETFYNNGKPKSVTFFNNGQQCLGTKEWTESGDEINNDFKITVTEHNKVNLENKLYFYITLQNPQPDDEMSVVLNTDTGNVITRYQTLEKQGDHFVLEYSVYKGGFVMEQVKVAGYRQTHLGNTFIKTTSFNVSANHF